MTVLKHQELLSKVSLMAQKNELYKIKDINQIFQTEGFGKSNLLGLAAYEGDELLVDSLLKAGANVSATMQGYREDYTPLHMVIYGGKYGKVPSFEGPESRVKIIDMLHKYGADLNSESNEGYSWTPLTVASYYQVPTLYHELLILGADPFKASSIPDHHGIRNLLSNKGFYKLACEEAKNKYVSGDNGYKLSKNLHNNVIDTLLSVKFSVEESHLMVKEQKFMSQFPLPSALAIFNDTCAKISVEQRHTDIFDLSEVQCVGSFDIEDLA